jgi:SnoaL-like domain
MGAAVEPGRQTEIPVTFVCTFRDGLITSDRAYFDTATLAEQLGADDQTAGYVTPFGQFWCDPAGDLVPELVRPDAVVSWPGIEPLSGADYPAHMDRVLQRLPDLRLEVADHAANGATAFISWRARATVGDAPMEWTGTDRVVVRAGRAVVLEVRYDTAPIMQALTAASAAGAP